MTEIEIGKEYRLLPGAKFRDGIPSAANKHGATRVCVERGPNEQGDYTLLGLDGAHGGRAHYLAAAGYLAPLDEPAAEAPKLETLGHAEVIAQALDGAYVPLGAYWVKAEVKYGPNGGCAVLVTLDPDVGYTAQYSLTMKEV